MYGERYEEILKRYGMTATISHVLMFTPWRYSKNTRLQIIFSTLFPEFDNVVNLVFDYYMYFKNGIV